MGILTVLEDAEGFMLPLPVDNISESAGRSGAGCGQTLRHRTPGLNNTAPPLAGGVLHRLHQSAGGTGTHPALITQALTGRGYRWVSMDSHHHRTGCFRAPGTMRLQAGQR